MADVWGNVETQSLSERMTMLLERQTQLEQLDELLAEAANGRGRVVALSGEAGAGKSALVEAFTGAAGQGAHIFRSACEDLSIPDPLGPLYDLAREAQWAMPQAVAARRGERLPLFSDALDVFEARTGTTLLVIEDLHWADDATLDFVRFLGRRIANTHILLLVTARTDRSEGQMRVRRALGEIPSGSVARIDVPLLSEAAVLSRYCGMPSTCMRVAVHCALTAARNAGSLRSCTYHNACALAHGWDGSKK